MSIFVHCLECDSTIWDITKDHKPGCSKDPKKLARGQAEYDNNDYTKMEYLGISRLDRTELGTESITNKDKIQKITKRKEK